MRVKRFDWLGPKQTAYQVRVWAESDEPTGLWKAVDEIGDEVMADRDAALVRLTRKFDAPEFEQDGLRVDPDVASAALESIDPALHEALSVAAINIRAVAEAQVHDVRQTVDLIQGQRVTVREVPVKSAGVYAPGGRATYPSSVLMCAIPARIAGVERIAVVSPPDRDGRVSNVVLAAAAMCGVDEIYAVGGAQAIFGLAYGTETIDGVDVVVGPGNTWVQEAKRIVNGFVGIDSYAGPSELMVIAGHDADPEWIALDLCAQAEHGNESPLLVASVEEQILDAIEEATVSAASKQLSIQNAPLAMVQVPDTDAAIDLANAFAPEHLELIEEDASLLADRVTTAGCVFAGRFGATAFGDYVAGSNHVLPTSGAGRHAGPLGPGVFRRKISTVEVSAEAAAKLAPHVDTIARAEGFPVHGESAMIRTES